LLQGMGGGGAGGGQNVQDGDLADTSE